MRRVLAFELHSLFLPLPSLFLSFSQSRQRWAGKLVPIWLLSACLLSRAAAPDRLWAARGTRRVHRRSWHPAHIQPQTGVTNLLSASRDSAKTKGSAWDTTTLRCRSTDGMKVLCVTQGVKKCLAHQHVLSRPVFFKLPVCHCFLETSTQPGKPFPSEPKTEALFILHFHFLLPGNFSLQCHHRYYSRIKEQPKSLSYYIQNSN